MHASAVACVALKASPDTVVVLSFHRGTLLVCCLTALCRFPDIARAELSSRRGLGVNSTFPSRMARPGARPFTALCCECLLRSPNHDVAVVTMVRAELSSHLVGIHKASCLARAGCLFEGVMVTNCGCSSQPG